MIIFVCRKAYIKMCKEIFKITNLHQQLKIQECKIPYYPSFGKNFTITYKLL